MSAELKKAFLEAYKQLGYKNLACEKVSIETTLPNVWAKQDAEFAMNWDVLKSWWKDNRKEKLDIMLYQTAVTNSKGFMHAMAWLRANGFDEYNPKSTVERKNPQTDQALKGLIDRIDKYAKREKKNDK